MEKIFPQHIVEFLDRNGVLSNCQFGLRRGGSIDSGFVDDIVYLDFSKAFNAVSHLALMENLYTPHKIPKENAVGTGKEW